MRRISNILTSIRKRHIVAIAAICLFVSCNTNVQYHHYEHIAHSGWDKRDTVTFCVDTIYQAGDYTTTLCLRTTTAYPYRNISMRIFGEVRPARKQYTKRLDFEVANKNGSQTGRGITFFTHEIPIGKLHLQPGDTLLVKVGHNMRPEVIQGIEDIGIKIGD